MIRDFTILFILNEFSVCMCEIFVFVHVVGRILLKLEGVADSAKQVIGHELDEALWVAHE